MIKLFEVDDRIVQNPQHCSTGLFVFFLILRFLIFIENNE